LRGPTTVALIVIQEMAARMGAVTGKGLSDLIREEFGLRMTFFTMAVLGLADLGNIAAEFAGLASGLGMFGVSKYVAVPLGGTMVWAIVVRGSYKHVDHVRSRRLRPLHRQGSNGRGVPKGLTL
jgi:Mn2+/Fe2+ NRAMP family transporter